MIRFCLCVFVIINLLFSCAIAYTSGLTTIDPNTKQSVPDTSSVDVRLAQKVTCEYWHTPVKTILADLSQKTGVVIYSGYNKDDWQVRDRRMNVYVHDVSLAQLMNSTARVMKFKWSINDEKDPPTYRLYADRKLIGKLQAESSKRQRELKSEETRRRSAMLQEFERISKASGTEIQELREKNPYLYMSAKTGFAEFVTRMLSEDLRIRNAFLSGEKNLKFDTTVLSESTQQLFAEVTRKMWPYDRLYANRAEPPVDMEQTIGNYQVHMELMCRPDGVEMLNQLLDFGTVATVVSNGDHMTGWLRDPYADSTKAWAEAYLVAEDQGMDCRSFYLKSCPAVKSVISKDAKQIEYYLMFDPVIEHPDEPELQRTVNLKMTDEAREYRKKQLEACGRNAEPRIDYQLALKLLSDTAQLDIVSDSFSVVIGKYPIVENKEELQKVINEATSCYKCNWEKHGSVLEICRRDWFNRRSSQIPDEWVKQWRDELDQTGTVTLDTYAQMATLDEDQIEENILSDQLLNRVIGLWWSYGDNQGFLRFYKQLNTGQRNLLFTSEGLSPHLLSPVQSSYYTDMFHYGRRYTWDTEQFSKQGAGSVVIKGTGSPTSDGGVSYIFKAVLTNSVREEVWYLPLPRIANPKSESKKR